MHTQEPAVTSKHTISCENAIGHTRKIDDSLEPLVDHLHAVADMCRDFSSKIGFGEIGYLLGLLHDLGKFNPTFQQRLFDNSIHVDHMTPGALYVQERLSSEDTRIVGTIARYLIACHHGGLLNWSNPSVSGQRSILQDRSDKSLLADSMSNGGEDFIEKYTDNTMFLCTNKMLRNIGPELHHICRLLFSCLVDSDCLATERWCSPDTYLARTAKRPTIRELYSTYVSYMKTLSNTDTKIGTWRNQVRDACLASAVGPRGIYMLRADTGSGKTLASMGFGLRHALNNGMDRVIVCIPRCTIIEQTANVFRRIFGRNAVVEHHSNVDLDKVDENGNPVAESKSATENWDAPIIVTTDVQLFESLMSSKNSRCRKLHNISNSVVVVDEVHMFPTAELESLAHSICVMANPNLYRCSVVLCSATMPSYITKASHRLPDHIYNWFAGFPVYDILPPQLQDSPCSRAEYVPVRHITADEIADRVVKDHCSVLVVRNTNRFTSDMYAKIMDRHPGKKVYYLSSRLCGAHRSKVVEEIRNSLSSGEEIILVSTPIIEVGVDIDFPVVYRELCGMNSIKQCAGRCNREGKLESGTVYVCDIFMNDATADTTGKPKKRKPRCSDMDIQRDAMLKWCNGHSWELQLINAEAEQSYREYDTYYMEEYTNVHRDDSNNNKYLFNASHSKRYYQVFEKGGIGICDFESLNDAYKLIPDDQYHVLIPYDDTAKDRIKTLLNSEKISVSVLRSLQRYVVNLYKSDVDKTLAPNGVVKPTGFDGIFVLEQECMYGQSTGIQVALDELSCPEKSDYVV